MFDTKIMQVRNIPELLNLAADSFSSEAAVVENRDGSEAEETYRDFITRIRKTADYLDSIYSKKHIYVIPGVMSRSWLYVFFAILYSGHIAVPVDLLTADTVREKLGKLKPDAVFTDESTPSEVKELISEQYPGIPTAEMEEVCVRAAEKETASLRMPVDPGQTAMLVFTSGTTGENKIVEITHRNLCADTCLALTYLGPDYPAGTRYLTALPLDHMYAVTSCIMCPVMGGQVICIGGGVRKLKNDIQFFRPHLLMVVPMMLTSFMKRLFPDRVLVTSEQLAQAKRFFGGRLRLLYSGGAPLGREYYDIMTLLGIFLVNGYGITECSPIISYDNEEYHREGSVGKPGILPEICTVRIEDGEICVRGEIVSPGYYGEPELNRLVYKDGWFHTGDLGTVDDDGFLFITGRKKNILILPDGNNISLDELEKQVESCPSVKEAVIISKEMLNSPVLEAVICPMKNTGLEGDSLKKQIEAEIEEVNKKNPRFKHIAQIRLLDAEFEHTALGKVRKYKYES